MESKTFINCGPHNGFYKNISLRALSDTRLSHTARSVLFEDYVIEDQ